MTSDQLLSAKDFAVRRIRAMIYNGDFDTDGRLSIADLADALGVSRTPVRDALWQLAGEGLVTVSPRVGAFLRRVTPAEAADIYRIKVQMEPVMAGWAAERGSAEGRARYAEEIDCAATIAVGGHVNDYVTALEHARELMLDLADSPPLRAVLSVIDGRVRLLRLRKLSQPGQLEVSAAQHRTVARAIAAGDAHAAGRAMTEHMEDALRRVLLLAERHAGDAENYWLAARH
jgi:DNA-binding GntR family transcriptional regulator